MKKHTIVILRFLTALFCFVAPQYAFASLAPVITFQPLPKIYSAADSTTWYAYNENVLYQGQWTLPPEYLAKIKYIRDGALLPHFDVVNTMGLGTTTGNFSWDAGSTITSMWDTPTDQTPGVHNTRLQILAEPLCINAGTCLPCVSQNNPVNCKWRTVQITNARNYNIISAPVPVLQVTPAILPPFSVTEGSFQEQVFTVGNIGSSVLNGAVSITGGSGTFTCVPSCPSSYVINPGNTLDITIRFWPMSTVGTPFNASVQFTCSNCTPTTSVARAVTGNSVAKLPPSIGLYKGGTTTPLPATVPFGVVAVGSTKNVMIRVQNDGANQGGTLDGAISFASDTGQYSCPISSACNTGCNYFGLDAGQFCDIRVSFAPIASGLDNPTATFSNIVVGASGKVTRSFTGTGNDKPKLEVTALPPVNADCSPGTINPSSCDLTTGGTFVNVGTSKTLPLEIRNVGVGLMSGAVSISPLSDFSCSGPCPTFTNIAPGDPPVTINLRFTPQALGTCADPSLPCTTTITFTNPGGFTPSLSFPVSANGNNGAFFNVNNDTINTEFGDVLIGDTMQQSSHVFKITNTGATNMTVAITTPPGSFTCIAPVSCSAFTVPPGVSTAVNYVFAPTSAGLKTSTIVIATNAGTYSYDLTGTGIRPSVSVTPTSPPDLDFGVVNILDTSSPQSYTIKNTGSTNFGAAGDNTVSYTVATSTHFDCVAGCSGTLTETPQEFATVFIVFKPGMSTGAISETITFKYSSVPFPTLFGSSARDVTGVGNDGPWISVTPLGGTDFGTVDMTSLGGGKNLVFQVKNTGIGPFPLIGSIDTTTLGTSFSCVAGCGTYTLNPGETANVTIRFAPTADGFITTSATFTGAAGGTLMLSGTGNLVREANISLAGAYDFGTVSIGDTPASTTVLLQNTGLGNWKGEVSVELPFKCSPADASGRCFYNIPAGGSDSINLSFAPNIEGANTSNAGFSGRTNPVAYFPFDKEDNLGGGVVRDASGNKLDGTLTNGADFTPIGGGNFGEAIIFDGVNDYVSLGVNKIGPRINGSSGVTVSAWVNTTTFGAPAVKKRILSIPMNDTLMGIVLNALGSTFEVSARSKTTDSLQSAVSPSVVEGQWVFVVGKIDFMGKTITTYINGVPQAPTAVTFDSNTYVNGVPTVDIDTIVSAGGASPFFKGLVDEVEIFNRAITPGEVAALALKSEKSKTFDQSLLARLRRIVINAAQANHSIPPTDKISLLLSGTATFNPLINIDIGTFDFGRIKVGKFKDQIFRFTNTGAGTLGPGTLSVGAPFSCLHTENDAGIVSLPGTCPYSVAAGSFFEATVRFAPTAKGIFSQDLVFSNPPGLIALPLQGEGVSQPVKFIQF